MRYKDDLNKRQKKGSRHFVGVVAVFSFGCVAAAQVIAADIDVIQRVQIHKCQAQVKRTLEYSRVVSKKLDAEIVARQLPEYTRSLGQEPGLQATLECLMQVKPPGSRSSATRGR